MEVKRPYKVNDDFLIYMQKPETIDLCFNQNKKGKIKVLRWHTPLKAS